MGTLDSSIEVTADRKEKKTAACLSFALANPLYSDRIHRGRGRLGIGLLRKACHMENSQESVVFVRVEKQKLECFPELVAPVLVTGIQGVRRPLKSY